METSRATPSFLVLRTKPTASHMYTSTLPQRLICRLVLDSFPLLLPKQYNTTLQMAPTPGPLHWGVLTDWYSFFPDLTMPHSASMSCQSLLKSTSPKRLAHIIFPAANFSVLTMGSPYSIFLSSQDLVTLHVPDFMLIFGLFPLGFRHQKREVFDHLSNSLMDLQGLVLDTSNNGC